MLFTLKSMRKYFLQLSIIFICTFFLFCNKESNDNIDIRLSINHNSYKSLQYKYVKIIITNKNDSTIFFPEWLCHGNIGDSQTEIYFKILKKNPVTNNFEEITQADVDVDYLSMGRLNMIIRPGGKYELEEELDGMYDLHDTGYYKVQAVIDFENPYKFKKKSTWTEFYISNN
jgi:hypothetical protein